MDSLEGFLDSEDVSDVLQKVSKLPPKDVLSYLISTSRKVLAVYAKMRDSLPRGYGKIKFSHFVDVKDKQVSELCRVALKLYPEAFSSDVPGETVNFSVKTVGDYLEILNETIKLEELQLKACKYLSQKIDNPDLAVLLDDLAAEIAENIEVLQRELERVKQFERRAKFSEFVKELVGDKHGRG